MSATFAVVTPVLNGAAYIETAVRSVFAQTDVDVDYVVVDGGSTDGTQALLAAFGPKVRVVRFSGNQASAIDHGIGLARGDIVAILNADDWYLPSAFTRVAAAFEERPDADVVYGSALVAGADGAILRRQLALPFRPVQMFDGCPIVQPASFLRRSAYVAVGGMTRSNQYTCDYDLWVRLTGTHVFVPLEDDVAVTREHHDNKSSLNRASVLREAMASVAAVHGYVPYPWFITVAKMMLTGDDRKPSWVPSPLPVLLSLFLGIARNRGEVRRFVREWWSYRWLGGARAPTD